MAEPTNKSSTPSNWLILTLAVTVYVCDQFAKWLILNLLPVGEENNLLPGFFKFVHWGNTGAAWSLFSGNNAVLAVVGLGALVLLIFTRHHFHAHTIMGQIALASFSAASPATSPTASCPVAMPLWISSIFICNPGAAVPKLVFPPLILPTALFAPA